MPWGWYFASALPRALHGVYLLAPLGAWLDSRARPLFGVALLFVLLYSNLGHKEVSHAHKAVSHAPTPPHGLVPQEDGPLALEGKAQCANGHSVEAAETAALNRFGCE